MPTSYHTQRVRQNILPFSLAGELPEAFGEWYFTENTQDHETPDAECQLCDKEELRYHFQIKNMHTGKELWVGSKCILKFGLSVFEGKTLLGPKEAKKKLDQLTKKMQLESCIKALELLAIKEGGDILRNALDFYKTNKYLTPKYAFVVFWRLNTNLIEYHPSFFKISLKKEKFKKHLKDMKTDRVHIFWKALTSSQKKLAEELGHLPPAT